MFNLKVQLEAIYDLAYDSHASLRDILSAGFATHKGFELGEEEWKNARRDILFLGINPSYNEAHRKAFDPIEFLSAANAPFPHFTYDPFAHKSEGEKEVRYFQDIKQLISDAGLEEGTYTYVDLFHFRATDQHTIRNMMSTPGWVDFLCDQLRLTDFYIRQVIQPRIIVVVNAEAMNFLGANQYTRNNKRENVWLGYEIDNALDPLLGLQRIKACLSDIPNIKEGTMKRPCYILPSSILTYMSGGNKTRLAWTLQRAHRLLQLFGEEMVEQSPIYKLLKDLECELPRLKVRKAEAVAQNQFEFAAKDRDAERVLMQNCRVLLDETVQKEYSVSDKT